MAYGTSQLRHSHLRRTRRGRGHGGIGRLLDQLGEGETTYGTLIVTPTRSTEFITPASSGTRTATTARGCGSAASSSAPRGPPSRRRPGAGDIDMLLASAAWVCCGKRSAATRQQPGPAARTQQLHKLATAQGQLSLAEGHHNAGDQHHRPGIVHRRRPSPASRSTPPNGEDVKVKWTFGSPSRTSRPRRPTPQ